MARKGIWAPAPSFELGAGLTYLVDSSDLRPASLRKIRHPRRLPQLPDPVDRAARGVSRLLGTNQVDMTIISSDLSVSKSFGLGGSVKLDPYLGANLLVSIVRSQVIDTTPGIDAYKQGPMSIDLNANTTFPDPDAILRWRLFHRPPPRLVLTFCRRRILLHLCNDSGSDRRHDFLDRQIFVPLRRPSPTLLSLDLLLTPLRRTGDGPWVAGPSIYFLF